jgi:cytochrome c peroxidase
MLMKSINRSMFTAWLLVPVIAGLLMTGWPPPARAQVALPTFPIQTPDDAKTWGLDSLGNMMRSSTAIGQPLVLNPEFKVPLPGNLRSFVKDRQAALRLGKALFWEMQVGSDGIQSCATCHFQAGGDIRSKNQVATQGNRRLEKRGNGDASLDEILGYFFAPADPDTVFETVFGITWAPNYQLVAEDFPLVNAQNLYLRSGDSILPDTANGNRDDVVGSMGVMPATFGGITPGSPVDIIKTGTSPGTMRPTTGRNAPPSVQAVFNYLQFWDGRADSKFNGFNPIGRHDTSKPKYFVNLRGTRAGGLQTRTLNLELASLASQATGPPLSDVEMSYAGRTWPDIGKKLLRAPQGGAPLRPLAYQTVSPSDSVLGPIANPTGPGLTIDNYADMIKAAFRDDLWNWEGGRQAITFPQAKLVRGPLEMNFIPGDHQIVDDNLMNTRGAKKTPLPAGYTQMEANFSLFWGIAVMLYEAELVSHKSKFDQWMEGTASLTLEELDGLNVFVNQGKCIACHGGPEFTNASVRGTQQGKENIEPIRRKDGTPSFYTNGFYNVGVEPTVNDISHGAPDPFGRPWGSARQFLFQKNGIMKIPFTIDGLPIRHLEARNPVDTNGDGTPDQQELWKVLVDLVTGAKDEFLVCIDLNMNGVCDLSDDIKIKALDQDGSCKASHLRNVELNGPYFHNGDAASLQQVLQNYDVGGKFNHKPLNQVDMLPDVTELNLAGVITPNGNPAEPALVAFLLTLTDQRVKTEAAPFDHPQLFIPVDGTTPILTPADPAGFFATQIAAGNIKELPATGAGGGVELQPFISYLAPFTYTNYDENTGKPPFIETP